MCGIVQAWVGSSGRGRVFRVDLLDLLRVGVRSVYLLSRDGMLAERPRSARREDSAVAEGGSGGGRGKAGHQAVEQVALRVVREVALDAGHEATGGDHDAGTPCGILVPEA
jgi:hypothetical protein